MKTKFIAVLLVIGLGANAQTEPFDQFFYKTLWDQLPGYDSITVWCDSLTSGCINSTYGITHNGNGLIDTMRYDDVYSGQPGLRLYLGVNTGVEHIVSGFYNSGTSTDPYNQTRFVFGPSGGVTEVYLASYNGTTLEEDLRYKIGYRSNGKVNHMHIGAFTDPGWLDVLTYFYYYTNDRLDSTYLLNYFTGDVLEKILFTYDMNGKLKVMDFYNDYGIGTGFMRTRTFFFQHNAENKIRYVEKYFYDHNSATFVLDEIVEYGFKKKNNTGLPSLSPVQFSLYPVPVTDYLVMEGEALAHYRIINIQGSVVAEGEVIPRLDLSALEPGYYLVQVTDRKGGAGAQRILKQ